MAVGALATVVVSEPVKGWIARPKVAMQLIAVESTTPAKRQWKMDLTPSQVQALAAPIVGPEWVDSVDGNDVTYGAIEDKFDALQRLHTAYPGISGAEAWQTSTEADQFSFYESHREVIRTALRYVQHLPRLARAERDKADSFLRGDAPKKQGNILDPFRMLATPRRHGTPRNAPDIVEFAGRHLPVVVEETKPLLEALQAVLREGEVLEPSPSFKLLVDIGNTGGRATTVSDLATLRVQKPGSQESIKVIARFRPDPRAQPLLAAGERQRFELKAEALMGLNWNGRVFSKKVAELYAEELERQRDALALLSGLYGTDLVDCALHVGWGEGGEAVATGRLGATHQLSRLKGALE